MIGGSPESIWAFLKDLQRHIGLTDMPLRDYFDAVIARDNGTWPRVIFRRFQTLIQTRRASRHLLCRHVVCGVLDPS